MGYMEFITSRHKRSKSDCSRKRVKEDKFGNTCAASYCFDLDMGHLTDCGEPKKRQHSCNELQNSLKEEPAKDLIKEIAVLELEIAYLEKYLLTMYRKAFSQGLPSATMDVKPKSNASIDEQTFSEASRSNVTSSEKSAVICSSPSATPQSLAVNHPKERSNILRSNVLDDSGIHRSYSSLSQRSTCNFATSPPFGALAEAVHSFQSLPLSMLQHQNTASNACLTEHLGSAIQDRVKKTPNLVSEEMIKCISAVYCQLAEPPLSNHGFPSSPVSFSSSTIESFRQGNCEIKELPHSFSSWLSNPLATEESKEFSGSFSAPLMVLGLWRDGQSLKGVENMLQSFRFDCTHPKLCSRS